jgi:hypothetical protein
MSECDMRDREKPRMSLSLIRATPLHIISASTRHASASPRHDLPELCQTSPSNGRRAQGMPGAQAAPQPCARKVKAHKHSHHRLAETFRHSLRDGVTAYSALFPVIGLSCHRRS